MSQKYFKKNLSFWIPSKNKVHLDTIKHKRKVTTFQQALRAIVVIGQVFSLLPVVGVFSDDANKVRFVRKSWKCVYSLLSIFGQTFMTIFCIKKLLHSPVTLNECAPVIFYAMACITMVIFFKVARSWPHLVQHICRFEEISPNFDVTLNKKCNITCAVVLLLALLEHILSELSAYASAAGCTSREVTYKRFVSHFYPWIFNYISYTPLLGAIVQFLHFQATFVWNFSDLFVICMSYYLTSRLEQVNKKLNSARGKYLPAIFWRATREDYCRESQTVRKVDDVISGIVFVAFANNLFFVCLQLYNIIEDGLKGTEESCSFKAKKSGLLGGHEGATYLLFSLVYLILRSVAVSLIASEVNSASLVPAPILYDVPAPVYCIEVQRFLDQVNGEKVALSGLQFFVVTRGLLLTVAGTIVTYELVMVQFNSPTTASNSTSSMLFNITTAIITNASLI